LEWGVGAALLAVGVEAGEEVEGEDDEGWLGLGGVLVKVDDTGGGADGGGGGGAVDPGDEGAELPAAAASDAPREEGGGGGGGASILMLSSAERKRKVYPPARYMGTSECFDSRKTHKGKKEDPNARRGSSFSSAS
jgi:hypothetical protein